MASSPENIDTLVCAFKAVWQHYFRADRTGGVPEDVARPALVEFLVGKVKEGVDDEPSLAAAGLEFLFSLEDRPEVIDDADLTWNVCLENARARFVPVGHVRWIPDRR